MSAGHAMAAVDAQFYWMSAKIPNDQFLLYAFAGVPEDLDAAVAEVLGRARSSPELTMRADDSRALAYPRWLPAVEHLNAVRHRLADDTWTGCLDAVVRLADDQLDIRCAPWRLHLFAPVRDIPGSTGAGTVAVLQVAHALADGARASALAAWMFGRAAPVPAVAAPQRRFLPWRAVAAARDHRRQIRDTRAGLLPPAVGDRPVLATNTRPTGARTVRTLVRRRAELPGPTVTVGVLAAVSAALSDYLGLRCDSLGAEVPMAKTSARQANNHFGNIRAGLYPQLPRQPRAQRIADDLANGRRRAQHPAARSADRAFAAVPAALLRWGVARFDPDGRPVRVAGNTVVSSVHRGAADLHFGTAPVLLTAGFPALSPAMGLTHGVHGIGDTIAISVHAAESAIGDIDGYLRRLDAAL
jgi:hypothetical protein